MISIKRVFLFLLFTSILGLTAVVRAQQVIGVSYISYSASANEIDGWSETDMDYATAYYYDCYTEGYLFQDQTQVDAKPSGITYPSSGVPTSAPLNQGSVYTLYSEHYLVAYYDIYTGGYDNPYQFPIGSGFAPGYGGDPSGTGYDSGGGDLIIYTHYLDLGYTWDQVSTAPPSITSITPPSDNRGASGTIHVQGQNLLDDYHSELHQLDAYFRNDSDITTTVNVTAATSTQADISYSISSSAAIGNHQLVLKNVWGESEPVNFTVGYPPAVIQTVTPNVWSAGSDYDVEVTGSGFGDNPTITVAAPYVSAQSAHDTSTNGSISVTHFHVHIDSAAPDESFSISVTPGYAGSNFICGTCNGSSPTGSAGVFVDALPAPMPQISFNNAIISQTQSVIVGQQVYLTPVISLPQGVTIASQSWSNPPGTAIGGYNASNTSAAVVPLPQLSSSSSTPYSINFYWLDDASGRNITYSYTTSTDKSNQVTVQFDVQAGPTNVNMTATPGPGEIFTEAGVPTLSIGDVELNGQPGMRFDVTMNAPAGQQASALFVQLVNRDFSQARTANATLECEGPSNAPALDLQYPMPNTIGQLATGDSPSDSLEDEYGESKRFFFATTYLMWMSTNTPCNGSAGTDCNVPIPYGYIPWKYGIDATNTLVAQNTPNVGAPTFNDTIWKIKCAHCTNTPLQFVPTHFTDPSYGFPTWSSKASECTPH